MSETSRLRMCRYGDHHNEHLRRMAEPEPLRELRRQAERIEIERRANSRRMFDGFEMDRLRRQIRAAGEVPCR